jgi:exosortase E/protease (VPEID-CTERM system)
VLPEQSVIGVDAFEVVIAPICSGVDGFGLVLVFQVLWLSLARARIRFGRALLLLPLGAVAAMGTNIVRIAVLVLLGASGREDLALGAFHSKLGWLLFVAVALASVAAAEHVAWFRRPDAATPAAEEGVPRGAGAYLGPLVAALGASLLTSLWGERSLDPWYGARVAAAGLVLLAVRNQLPRPALTLSCVPVVLSAAVSALWIAWPHAGAAVEAPRAAWVAARLLGSCLVLPIVEELAFRGFLLPWLVSPDFEAVPPRKWTLPAVLLSSLAFGALHERWMLGTFAGLAFAAARLWRGRLGDAILAHALANAGIAAAVLIGGRWDLWS